VIENLICDWDGVFSVIELEAQAYLEAYRRKFIEDTGIDAKLVMQHLLNFERAIASDVDYKMTVNGLPTGRANVTPYDLNRAVFTELIDFLRIQGLNVPKPEDVNDYLHSLHKHAHGFVGTAYRNGAARTLQSFKDLRLNVTFVTSSGTEKVRGNLDELGFDFGVFGNAKKYQVDSDEGSMVIPGYGSVFVCRQKYLGVLRILKLKNGYEPENTLAIGDIFEHDLAVPFSLGYRVALFDSDTVIQPERDIITNTRMGVVVSDLDDLASEVLRMKFPVVDASRFAAHVGSLQYSK